MRTIKIKDVMTPLSDYLTIREDQPLMDVFQAIESAGPGAAHRDMVVLDSKGEFKGKVTMIDIFRTLEPNYQKLNVDYSDGTLTKEDVIRAIQDFNLWMEPVKTLCERGAAKPVGQVMHRPETNEFIESDQSLEKALHQYVMGVHQPLVVTEGGKVTGLLRFEDLYKVVRDQMLACSL